MSFTRAPKPSRLQFEILEKRDVPAIGSWLVEPFTRGAGSEPLPANWSQWSTGPGGLAFEVDQAGAGLGGQGRLIADGSSATAGRAWLNTIYSADVEASASVFLNSLSSTQLLVRGQNLNTAKASYYAVGVVRGTEVQLLRVVNGVSTVLALVKSNEWLSNTWVTVRLRADGDQLRVFLSRSDTNQYLDAKGNWTRQPTSVIDRSDTALRTRGQIGFARPQGIQAQVPIDSLKIGPADETGLAPLREERFQRGAAEGLPSGWSSWIADAQSSFETISDETLIISGTSASAARVWMTQPVPTDVQVSTSVYVDSLVSAGLFARGSWLNSNKANYYEVAVKRGLELELVKVVNGTRTTIGRLSTDGWQSGVWVQLSLITKGDQLRVQLFRADTGQYLGANGKWSLTPAYALVRTDRSLPSGSLAGLSRGTGAADDLQFDNFIVTPTPANLTAATTIPTEADKSTTVAASPIPPVPPVTKPTPAPVTPTPPKSPPASPPPPPPVVTAPPPAPPVVTPFDPKLPTVQRHYSHIRVATLAYEGTPLSSLELSLIKNSIDLIIPNLGIVDDVARINPKTPQIVYTNVSNIYLGLITDWLQYADKNKLDRESLFYHVNKPTTFFGFSASAVPVNHFWGVFRSNPTNGWTYLTQQVRSGTTQTKLGGNGESFAIGYTEKFRELNFDFATGAASGWRGELEYVSAVDAGGNPTRWSRLNILNDGTNGYRTDGRITFDPPKDWVASSVGNSDRLLYVRIRTTGGTAAQAPSVLKLTGRNYANHDGNKGTIPVFDATADRDGDGYLNDAEYARRRNGHEARFLYESRLTFPYYGPNRYATNVNSPNLQSWTIDYHRRFAGKYPEISGFFVDNSRGILDVDNAGLIESTANYDVQYGNVLGVLNRSIGSKWLLTNTAGGGKAVESQVKNGLSYLEEFALRPLTANSIQVDDLLATLRRRRELSDGRGYEILDTYPAKYDAGDPRVMLTSLAMYYLVADPNHSFLMINGGNEPSTSWTRHWTNAITYNVGKPLGEASVLSKGIDPSNPSLGFQIYQRKYQNALVLYKPLSYTRGVTGTPDDATATTQKLDGFYRVVNNDGTLGPKTNTVRLRNGEGVTLARA